MPWYLVVVTLAMGASIRPPGPGVTEVIEVIILWRVVIFVQPTFLASVGIYGRPVLAESTAPGSCIEVSPTSRGSPRCVRPPSLPAPSPCPLIVASPVSVKLPRVGHYLGRGGVL